MTSVIRVKRRINENPAEALFVSCKRRRESNSVDGDATSNCSSEPHSSSSSVFSFVGTINTKDESISGHIKEAIKKKKKFKELHPHTTGLKNDSHLAEVTDKWRRETENSSRNNRYRVTWSRRDLNFDLSDNKDTNSDNKDTNSDNKDTNSANKDTNLDIYGESGKSEEGQVTSEKSPECKNNKCTADEDRLSPEQMVESFSVLHPSSFCHSGCGKSSDNPCVCQGINTSKNSAADESPVVKEDKMFCIFDLEHEDEGDLLKGINQTAEEITVNNIPMVFKKKVSTEPSDYVYDLYYTDSNLSGLDREAVLTVEALCNQLVHDEDDVQERDVVYEDEDDSNDENNWRADYPDEDPHFFENADEEYDYAEDMVDTNFLHEDEDGMLASWMNTRCKVGMLSDDDEDEYENDKSSQSSDE